LHRTKIKWRIFAFSNNSWRVGLVSEPVRLRRIRISYGLAGVGVLLFVTASASPADWYPYAQFLAGFACMAVSHVLTPCQDQITRWWRQRVLGQHEGRI